MHLPKIFLSTLVFKLPQDMWECETRCGFYEYNLKEKKKKNIVEICELLLILAPNASTTQTCDAETLPQKGTNVMEVAP